VVLKYGGIKLIYAKSKPIENLKAHTEKLIENYKILESFYKDKIKCNEIMWSLLYKAAKYHDAGKSYSYFQYKIIENINRNNEVKIENIKSPISYDIPHNYLSPAFIPFKSLPYSKAEKKILAQVIAYHHERDEKPHSDKIKEVIKKDLINHIPSLKDELEIEISENPGSLYTSWIDSDNRIKSKDDNYLLYILVKGLLHRLDHSASAEEEIENDCNENVAQYTIEYMNRKGFKVRNLQSFSRENKDKNVIAIASTGLGKTEAALLWIDEDKAFFTLPLRVSINALFDRVSKEEDRQKGQDGIGFKYAGLLHSTSMDYLEESDYKNWEQVYDSSKMLSNKLIFTTIDQIFKFPFKYRGYEKMYATTAYSKIVIDEIQAYSPSIAAVLIKGLEMIHKIGGRFMVMTATMPTIYIDELEKRGIISSSETARGQFLNEVIRHKIKVNEKPIISDIDEIIKRGIDKKVIVIVNTVDRAVEIYNEIYKKTKKTYLLHSLFIQKHRGMLERKIKSFADDDKNTGIWITTQIVEASLDVDFDYLFTEISTLDSLFQRLGRCYRKRKFNLHEPNVYIYTEDVKGVGTIYDKDVINNSKNMIKEFDMKELKESDKVEMVEKLYSKECLVGTEFYSEFKKAMTFLDHLTDEYDLSSNEAQRQLRDIDSITVIPREIFDRIEDLIENYKSEKDIKERKKVRREINKYTVSLPQYKVRSSGSINPCNISGLDDIYILNRKYDFDEELLTGKGVVSNEDLSNIW
jgi:CRISPR-associated endonuclease/helicase Cas3